MGFLDRFKHKNKNETNPEKLSNDNSNSFWMNQQAVVPYDDITERCADEYFLQKIIEEDSDIHRRGFAVYCLNTFVCDNNRNESFSKIMGYDLSIDDWHDVRDDYADLVNAINHFGRLTTTSVLNISNKRVNNEKSPYDAMPSKHQDTIDMMKRIMEENNQK